MPVKDAAKPATQAQLKAVHTKLDAKIDGVALELVKTQTAVGRIEANMVTKDDFRRIMAVFDGFAAKLEIYGRETVTFPHLLDEPGEKLRGHEARLGEHDQRLKAVETRR